MKTDLETTAPQDPNEVFLRVWTHHEPALRAFVHACLPRAAEVDEVMQNVSLVAWRKFPTLADHTLFPRWACLIARYEILMARRRHARDRLVLDEDVIARLADEGAEEEFVGDRLAGRRMPDPPQFTFRDGDDRISGRWESQR